MLGGAARPLHHTGKPVATTASASRVALSVTHAATPRNRSRSARMSPRVPTSPFPSPSMQRIAPAGQSSMATRWWLSGEPRMDGAERSSRMGMKRTVYASPTIRPWSGASGATPRMAVARRPRLMSCMVMVAVLQPARASRISGFMEPPEGG